MNRGPLGIAFSAWFGRGKLGLRSFTDLLILIEVCIGALDLLDRSLELLNRCIPALGRREGVL